MEFPIAFDATPLVGATRYRSICRLRIFNIRRSKKINLIRLR